MKNTHLQTLLTLFFLLIAFGCQPPKASLKSQDFQVQKSSGQTSTSGQIPVDVLRDASARYGGSIDAEPGGKLRNSDGAISVVLGPIKIEERSDAGPISKDAGQIVREVIIQNINDRDGIDIVDAPEERYIADAPRTDLSSRGIGYVIKGTLRSGISSGHTSIFLRMVDTSTGKVSFTAAGRGDNFSDAAIHATRKVLDEFMGEANVPEN